MPITGPTSYIPTTQAFLDHWTAANSALPAGQPLVLPNPLAGPGVLTTRASFLAARAALIAQREAIEGLDLDRSLARAALDLRRAWLHARMNLFNDRVRGALAGTAYVRALGEVPGVDAGLGDFTKPMQRTKALWLRINTDGPGGLAIPLVLQDGTDAAAFEEAVNDLAGRFDGVISADTVVTIGLEKRNDLQAPLYAAMKAYRQEVRGRFMPDNALVESLPALTAEGGRTPEAVSLAGDWNVAEAQAVLTVGASSDPGLAEYEVRYCVGPDYDGEQEHVAGTLPPGGPLVFKTTKGLTTPGAVASYKVFVVLSTGHEAGSAAVAVTRPG